MKLMVWAQWAAILCLGIVVGLQFRSIYGTREQNRTSACAAWRTFDETVIAQVRVGEKIAPTMAYYRRHPVELATVLTRDEAFVRKLVPPSYCN